MNRSLFRRDALPLLLLFLALVAATTATDALLHRLELVWIGRYLGIPGTLLILLSMRYSLRKHGLIAQGEPRRLLRQHEALAWLGSLLVLVHAGIHFRAILPWLATAAMLVNILSGLTGKFLLPRARRHVEERRGRMAARGLSGDQMDAKLYWDALMLDAMANWRTVHVPIALAFAGLALAHVLSIFLYWSWR
ncbi:MAG: hypothetical protein Q8Q73_12265 [Stagnimonas sp.]|nr:hypothetical protein [Stagnimonas sp.]